MYILKNNFQGKATLIVGEFIINGCQCFHVSEATKIFNQFNVDNETQQMVLNKIRPNSEVDWENEVREVENSTREIKHNPKLKLGGDYLTIHKVKLLVYALKHVKKADLVKSWATMENRNLHPHCTPEQYASFNALQQYALVKNDLFLDLMVNTPHITVKMNMCIIEKYARHFVYDDDFFVSTRARTAYQQYVSNYLFRVVAYFLALFVFAVFLLSISLHSENTNYIISNLIGIAVIPLIYLAYNKYLRKKFDKI